jgi:hypothetical protein
MTERQTTRKKRNKYKKKNRKGKEKKEIPYQSHDQMEESSFVRSSTTFLLFRTIRRK